MKDFIITLTITISIRFLLYQQELLYGTSLDLICILGFILISAALRAYATNLFGYNRLQKIPMRSPDGKRILLIGEVHLYNGAESKEVEKIIKPFKKIFHEMGQGSKIEYESIDEKPLYYKIFKILLSIFYLLLKAFYLPTPHVMQAAKKQGKEIIGLESHKSRMTDLDSASLWTINLVLFGILFVIPFLVPGEFMLLNQKLPSIITGYVYLGLFFLLQIQISGYFHYFSQETSDNSSEGPLPMGQREATMLSSILSLVNEENFEDNQPVFMGKAHILRVVADLEKCGFIKIK